MSVHDAMVGERVIVRADRAGTYVGVLAAVEADGIVLAPGTRQLWYWSAGGSVAQIAEAGIRADGSRVTAPSTMERVIPTSDVVQICRLTDLAWDRVQACDVWRGGL